MYKSLLPENCVKQGSYYLSTCTSPCCHTTVSIRVLTTFLHVQVPAATVLCQTGFLLPFYMYMSLLPQYCVKQGSYYLSTCTSPCCHSTVSNRVLTTFLHVHVPAATVLCQTGFSLPFYLCKSLLPQYCVNKGSYHPSTCTGHCCQSAVSIRFLLLPLYIYKSLLPQCCVNKFFYYPSTCTSTSFNFFCCAFTSSLDIETKFPYF